MDFLEVDGSYGEGGGQILRTALMFSIVLGKPIRVSKIRAGREVPGLRRQHVATLKVLGDIFESELTGAVEGSSDVSFVPGPPRLGSLVIDTKTAASITLVLQTVVPAVALSRSSLSIEVRGGTDVPWSPTLDYFDAVVRRAFAVMGINFNDEVRRRGYYPKGGGLVKVEVEPCVSLRPLRMIDSPKPGPVDIVSRCALLPRSVAERQLKAAEGLLREGGINVGVSRVVEEPADSPGSSILVATSGDGYFLGADALGARGKPAEEVGREAAQGMLATAAAGACVDINLADMLVPLLSLAPGPSDLRVAEVSKHLETSIYVAKLFTSRGINTRSDAGSSVVSIASA
ncbi:MAG: RNA 3'-terminal phosphate cyclase [Thaumarchaeota archaeon]|nr:RNA 3'-terminal phosphate cyclase [Nitrososphaerota archaeon]